MIGTKTERVRLVRRTRGKDDNGDYLLTEAVLAERWAAVAPLTGAESELAGQLRATMNYKVTLDLYGLEVTSDDRVKWLTRGGEIELNLQEIRLSPVRYVDSTLICVSGRPDGGEAP